MLPKVNFHISILTENNMVNVSAWEIEFTAFCLIKRQTIGVLVCCLSLQCHPVDGACIKTTCPTGTWGANCEHPCVCLNNAVCKRDDGSCTCPVGYEGKNCAISKILY